MNYPNILAETITVGTGTFIHPSAIIQGVNGKAKKIKIGDNCYIGHNVEIYCDDFEIGDYCKIHHHSNIHGYKPCKIGHNLWMGQFVILDTIGGVKIGDNCGIGAQSQLWSHIKFGDTLEGCRFSTNKSLKLGNDVWLVGRTILSPINAEDKSMALAGAIVTRDMKYNEIYAGAPAKSISNKVGFQFKETFIDEKFSKMKSYIEESGVDKNKINLIKTPDEYTENEKSTFIISTREYTKKGTQAEIDLMKFLLPEKAKFVPLI